MLLILGLPIFIILFGGVGVGITLLTNSYIIPLLGYSESSNITMTTGMIITGVIVLLYFILFTKNLESDRFKTFLQKKSIK